MPKVPALYRICDFISTMMRTTVLIFVFFAYPLLASEQTQIDPHQYHIRLQHARQEIKDLQERIRFVLKTQPHVESIRTEILEKIKRHQNKLPEDFIIEFNELNINDSNSPEKLFSPEQIKSLMADPANKNLKPL